MLLNQLQSRSQQLKRFLSQAATSTVVKPSAKPVNVAKPATATKAGNDGLNQLVQQNQLVLRNLVLMQQLRNQLLQVKATTATKPAASATAKPATKTYSYW